MTYVSMQEAETAFADAEEAAIRDWTCLCKCGCRLPGAQPMDRMGIVYAGICRACGKKGYPRHDVASAATMWTDMENAAERAGDAPQRPVAPEMAVESGEAPYLYQPSFFRQLRQSIVHGFRQGAGFDE